MESTDLNDYSDAANPPAEMPFTADHFQAALTAAGEVMPTLKGAGLTRKIQRICSRSPQTASQFWAKRHR